MMETKRRRLFYKRIDLRSRSAMIDYLTNHFRYPTMNSWNRSTSYACNLKVCELGLDHDIVDKLLDMIGIPEFYDRLRDLTEAFGRRHRYEWQAGWNGRSGGYLVLYQGETQPSQYRSYCTCCGQKNYRSVAETGARCGVCNEEARVDYDTPPMLASIFPGRGTDMGEDFEDWSLQELRQRTKLVMEFDHLADDIVSEGVRIAQTHSVQERTVFVPKKELVLAYGGVG